MSYCGSRRGTKMKKRILWLGLSFLLVAALVLTSCGEAVPGEQEEEEEEEITPTTLPAGMGIIEIRVTDAPPKYTVTQIIVEISEDEDEGGVQVHRADGEGGGVWETIDILGGQNPFILYPDLLGLEQVLAVGDMEAGKYTQIRMTVEMVEVTYLENGDGEAKTVEATIPSGELKFVRPFDVVEGGTTTLIIDFDADKSVVFTGADKVIFKPVVKLSIEHGEGEEEEEEELLGTIAGTVTDSSNAEPIEGATVVVEGTELLATTDGNGDYEIDEVPVETYTVTASAEGYDDDSQSVTVIAGETSTADFALEPIPTTGTIAGKVTDSSTGLAIEGATVTDGTRSAITGVNGDYTIDDVPVGTYTVTASAAGYDDDSQSVTVIAGETSTADFTLEPSA